MSQSGYSGREAIDLAVRPLVEALEQRQMLSASVEQGVWNIHVAGALESSDNRVVIATRTNNPSILQCGVNGKIYARTRVDRIKGLRLMLGSGDDQVTLRLGKHAKRLRADVLAGAGDDIIVAGPEANRLYGQDGDDQIIGGGGRGDRLFGGAGSNRVVKGKGRAFFPARPDDAPIDRPGDTPVDRPGDQDDPTGGEPAVRPWNPSQNIPYTDSLQQISNETELKTWLIDEAVRQYQGRLGGATTKKWSEYAEGSGPYYRLGESTFYPSPLQPHATTDIVLQDGSVSLRSLHVRTAGQDRGVMGPDAALLEPQGKEAGVQTPSTLRTDGRYLYVIAGGHVTIIDPAAPEGSQTLATLTVAGRLYDLYVDQGRLTIISQMQQRVEAPAGWEYDPWGDDDYQPFIQLSTYDVADPFAPELVETTTIDGCHGTARMIDGRLYLLVGLPQLPQPLQAAAGEVEMFGEETQQRYTVEQWQAIYALPAEQRADMSNWPAPVDITVRHHQQTWRTETVEEYRARLEAMTLDELMPGWTTTVVDAQGNSTTTSGTVVRTSEVYIPSEPLGSSDGRTGQSVLLLNPGDGTAGVDSAVTVYGTLGRFTWGGSVHSSADTLFYADGLRQVGTSTLDPEPA